MKMCIQADLDDADALRHMNKNNSERPVCTTHPLTPVSTFFLFVFDAEWVMSTCEHQGRDTVLQTGLKIHWSRRSASCCFNRVWRVTKHSAKHQSMLRPWVMQHQPWPSHDRAASPIKKIQLLFTVLLVLAWRSFRGHRFRGGPPMS